MSHRIHVRRRGVECATASLRPAARAALEHAGAPPGDLTIVLTEAAALRELNRRFGGPDRTTDVLSFPDGSTDPESGRTYHGDVVIAVPVAAAQARRGHRTLAEELRTLVVHGVLHLLGHDHATADDARRMRQAERAILAGPARRAPAKPQ